MEKTTILTSSPQSNWSPNISDSTMNNSITKEENLYYGK